MLLRSAISLWTIACVATCLALSPLEEAIVGVWRRDNSEAFTVMMLLPDHRFSVHVGKDETSLYKWIVGSWHVERGHFAITDVIISGEPAPEAACQKAILTSTHEKLVLEDNESYTRIK